MIRHLHGQKAYSIQEITTELQRVTQIKRMIDSEDEDRKHLIEHAFECAHISDEPEGVRDHERFFETLLSVTPEELAHIAEKSFPAITDASDTLASMDIDLSKMDVGATRDRHLIGRFVAAVQSYHNTFDQSASFAETMNGQAASLKRSLLKENKDEGISEFVNQVMRTQIPGFDIDRVTFGKDQDFGKAIYNDPKAAETISELQKIAKFDLKSMGKDTREYGDMPNQGDILNHKARSMMKEQSFIQRLTAKIREKDSDVNRSHLSEFGM